MTEEELIEKCRSKNRRAQKFLFDRYSPKMFGVCRRYVKNYEDAEDVMVEGFYKVLSKIDKFKGAGSFEGWIRRIMVNQALMFLRKNNNFKLSVEISNVTLSAKPVVEENLAAQDILGLLAMLPTGYRTVFNLYVIEGYKHREIGEILGISINTSKSQLILAKKRLRELVEKNYPDSYAVERS
ncbi:MAG: RNA polymerase sigma factor (sigma-70 family) [Cognaticolwellia sp.]